MVEYRSDALEVRAEELVGFFKGWPVAPTSDRQLEILRAASLVEIARENGEVIGFATAITDGTFAAFVSLLEVRSEHRGRGIGTELIHRIARRLDHCYAIDLVCDDDVVEFYSRSGWRPLCGMAIRHPQNIGGRSNP